MNKFGFEQPEVIDCPSECHVGDICTFKLKTFETEVRVEIYHLFGVVEGQLETLDRETFSVKFVPQYDGLNFVNIIFKNKVKSKLLQSHFIIFLNF